MAPALSPGGSRLRPGSAARSGEVSLGTGRMELPSVETETQPRNSKPQGAFQPAAPPFTSESLIRCPVRKRSALPHLISVRPGSTLLYRVLVLCSSALFGFETTGG